jgi:hypothetical protein
MLGDDSAPSSRPVEDEGCYGEVTAEYRETQSEEQPISRKSGGHESSKGKSQKNP